uniref:Cullin neddylation domain-containing protein n=1 Tax=Crocodylus porosus TaxID=8502 RepID=A0A7M4FW94_CROPO
MHYLAPSPLFQEVAVETLVEATGLSPVLVNHALKPLTDRDGILTQSHPSGGVLQLNEAALLRGSGQHLWLLPRQTYLNVKEDEGSTLARKRNIICCLIVQILKGEKQLHIDNLVFRVWRRGCWAWLFCFLSGFCCSSTDVLSCILHLLNQGYIRRLEDRPQLLEYISTEPLPTPSPHCQPHVTFQTVEIKKVPSAASAEKRQTFSTFR